MEAARERLRGAIYETPCPYSQTLSELSGAPCYLKLENLQMTGSFKERGAANLLLQLDDGERRRGVVAASAGNHGLAVAFHAARLGMPATIVMPDVRAAHQGDLRPPLRRRGHPARRRTTTRPTSGRATSSARRARCSSIRSTTRA